MSLPVALLAAAIGALFGTFGSWYVLVRLAPRAQRIAELRHDLYDFLPIVAEYWTVPTSPRQRALQEARILAQQEILKTKFNDLARTSDSIARAYLTSTHFRARLRDAATGPPFQSPNWTPDPNRPTRAAAAIADVIAKLPP